MVHQDILFIAHQKYNITHVISDNQPPTCVALLKTSIGIHRWLPLLPNAITWEFWNYSLLNGLNTEKQGCCIAQTNDFNHKKWVAWFKLLYFSAIFTLFITGWGSRFSFWIFWSHVFIDTSCSQLLSFDTSCVKSGYILLIVFFFVYKTKHHNILTSSATNW